MSCLTCMTCGIEFEGSEDDYGSMGIILCQPCCDEEDKK